MQTTICAAIPAASISIVRVSGPGALAAARAVFHKKTDEFAPRYMYLGNVTAPDGALIDRALCVYFAAPASYTGEDVVELHCHGGSAVAAQVVALLLQNGAVLAQPGEFTKRAFLNGKVDLSQAEAVQELVGALSEQGARMAARHLDGDLGARVRALQDALTDALAALEAGIEYPEENLEEGIAAAQLPALRHVLADARALAATYRQGKLLREGLCVAIAGRPNVGKSSLLNAILGQERAIVTHVAGTTRDVIAEYYNLDGLPVRFADTAGIRDTADEIERMGVSRSRAEVAEADVVLLLLDASKPLCSADREIFAAIPAGRALVVLNKTDLPAVLSPESVEAALGARPVCVSASTRAGIPALLAALRARMQEGAQAEEGLLLTSERHKQALDAAIGSLADALTALEAGLDLDCAAIDLHAAWHALGEITGQTLSEEIVDRIFEKFCLGK